MSFCVDLLPLMWDGREEGGPRMSPHGAGVKLNIAHSLIEGGIKTNHVSIELRRTHVTVTEHIGDRVAGWKKPDGKESIRAKGGGPRLPCRSSDERTKHLTGSSNEKGRGTWRHIVTGH